MGLFFLRRRGRRFRPFLQGGYRKLFDLQVLVSHLTRLDQIDAHHGRQSVQAFWEDFFSQSSSSRFEVEEIFGEGQRCVMRWTYHWAQPDGAAGHIRGVDIYRIRAGRICEKLSYVKG